MERGIYIEYVHANIEQFIIVLLYFISSVYVFSFSVNKSVFRVLFYTTLYSIFFYINFVFSVTTACSAPLGMESRLIKDAQISASSQWDGNHAAIQGRLNFLAGGGKQGGWSTGQNNANQWIQVDLLIKTKITAIATQGRNAYGQWVKKYRLQYSDDGVNFSFYKLPGQSSPKVLLTNYIENNTWARGDMKFIFECSTREIKRLRLR